MNVIKFVLSSKKEIYFREPRIEDTEKAAQVAGRMAGNDNQVLLGVLLQKELLKLLLVKIDEKELSLTEKENLSKLLTYKEYNQAMKALKIVVDEDEMGNVQTPEFLTIGDK